MTERQITPSLADDAQVRSLYETAFPVEEQIPYEDLKRLMAEMPLDFTAYYEGGTLHATGKIGDEPWLLRP